MLAVGAIASGCISGILMEKMGRIKALKIAAALAVLSWPCIGKYV